MTKSKPVTETKEIDDDDSSDIPFYLTFKETKSPISEINIHYQKNGWKEPLKTCFVDFDAKFSDGTIWWRTMFCCPFSGKVFHSSLPLCTLKEAYDWSDANSPRLKVIQQTDDFFGDFRLDGEFVFFKTVKNARKSVAIRVLETLSVGYEQSMFQSIAEFYRQTGRTRLLSSSHTTDGTESKEENNLTEDTPSYNDDGKVLTDVMETTENKNSTTNHQDEFVRKIPKWVNQLFDIGVDSTSFAIEFQERLSVDVNIQQKKPLCRSNPTLLYCKLSLYRPLALMAESKTYQSKTDSIHDAVSLIEKEITKKMSPSEIHRHCEEFKTKHKNDEWKEKAKMLDMVPKISSYIFHPPLSMTYPIRCFPSTNNNDGQSKKEVTLFVYEISLTTKQGDNFFSKIGLYPNSDLTRIGVIFGKDLFDYRKEKDDQTIGAIDDDLTRSIPDEPTIPIEAEFSLPQCQVDCGNIILSKRSKIHFKENEKEKLLSLQSFNCILDNWQSYGMSKNSVDFETVTNMQEFKWDEYGLSKRKCLFVPLKDTTLDMASGNIVHSDPIDWGIISDVMGRRNRSYIRSLDDSDQYTNIFGEHKSINLSQYCAFCVLAVIAPKIYGFIKSGFIPPWTLLEIIIFYIALLFVIIFLAIHHSSPIIETEYSKLQNRFFLQKKAAPRMYTTSSDESNKESPTASSSFPNNVNREVATNRNKYPTPKTYSEYYYRRYGVQIRYSNKKLVCVHSISNTKDAFPSKVCELDSLSLASNCIYVVPELITVLPMPRDFMYFMHNLRHFMFPLERMIQLHGLERRIFELSCNSPLRGLQQNHNNNRYDRKKLLRLLEECTTLSPCIYYERLEHLGDTVLGYFTSMNLVGRNYDLIWDSDDLGKMKNDSVKNKVFFKTALKIGLSSILGVSLSTSRWDFIYKQSNLFQNEKQMENLERENKFSNENLIVISDKVLSDVFESILGAVYRMGDSQLVLSLLEEFKLPLHGVDQRKSGSNECWFQSFGTCIEKGYPFELDLQWTNQMKQMSEVLNKSMDEKSRLESGWKQLLSILSKNCNISMNEEYPTEFDLRQLIILCSLFDDSLESDSQESVSDKSVSSFEIEGLQRVALFRDNLFVLGDSALHLCICTELFTRYPKASPGDLHLLRACVMCDDILAYIAMKSEIDCCLFDNEAPEISLLKSEASKSDEIGEEYFKTNNGWFISGGIREFQSRWNDPNWSIPLASDSNLMKPKYPGIIGGRFLGHESKLPSGLTGDLSFSFKAIVGGFVMSYGLERMWQIFLPILKEVMMFSPEELRSELSKMSPLFSIYKKGRSCHILDSYYSSKQTNK